MDLVIVAIPESKSPVWKVSSEKVPHLTLLYFGESVTPSQLKTIQSALEESIAYHSGMFELSVEERGVLGDDKADVLFLTKGGQGYQDALSLRDRLLSSPQVMKIWKSADQYPAWIPHLTLGYPETPAKPQPANNPIEPGQSIRFDKIALWTGDSVGPNYSLGGDIEMQDQDEDVLEHYGVKGMKWGVRRDRTTGVPRPSGARMTEATRKKVKSGGSVRGREVKLSTAQATDNKSDYRKAYPSGNEQPVSVKVTGRGRKTKASGGGGNLPSPEAIQKAVLKQQAAKSGSQSLTNAQLKLLNERMQLERSYQQLLKDQPKTMKQHALSFAGEIGKQQAKNFVNKWVEQKVMTKVGDLAGVDMRSKDQKKAMASAAEAAKAAAESVGKSVDKGTKAASSSAVKTAASKVKDAASDLAKTSTAKSSSSVANDKKSIDELNKHTLDMVEQLKKMGG